MSQHFAVIQQKTKQANFRVSKQISEYTIDLRKRLDKTTDFTDEYNKIFGDFSERKLPKDDLYYSIKNEIDSKQKDATKKKKKQKLGPGQNILPTVHEKKGDEIDANIHKDDVEREMDRLRRRER